MTSKFLRSIKAGWLNSRVAHSSAGFSLIEVLLAISIFSILISILVVSPLYGQESIILAGNRARALSLAEEGLEAARNLRYADFNNLTVGNYGLEVSNNRWQLIPSADITGIFSRQIEIIDIDSDTKEIIASVAWQWANKPTTSISVATYLTNWYGN